MNAIAVMMILVSLVAVMLGWFGVALPGLVFAASVLFIAEAQAV